MVRESIPVINKEQPEIRLVSNQFTEWTGRVDIYGHTHTHF